MCTSVPQIVVAVIRMTASPARGIGFGRSTTPSRPGSRNATAVIVSIASSWVEPSVQDDADDVPLLPAGGRIEDAGARRDERGKVRGDRFLY